MLSALGAGSARRCSARWLLQLVRSLRSLRSLCSHSHPGFEIFNRLFSSWEGTSWAMSPAAANFFAGGMASNMYWLCALREYPPRRF